LQELFLTQLLPDRKLKVLESQPLGQPIVANSHTVLSHVLQELFLTQLLPIRKLKVLESPPCLP
jgi:hypothetical protein